MLHLLLVTAATCVCLLSHAQLVTRDTDTERSTLMDYTLPGVLIHRENDHLAAPGSERRGMNEQMYDVACEHTHTAIASHSCSSDLSHSSTCSAPSALLYNASHPLTPSSHLLHYLPPLPPRPGPPSECFASLSSLPFPFLRIMHRLAFWFFLQFSFPNSPSLFSPSVFLFSLSVSLSQLTLVCLSSSLSLCPQVARRMIMRSRTEIHQCVTSMFSKSPLRAPPPPTPLHSAGPPPAHRPVVH